MKTKELKQLAKRIAVYESILQSSATDAEKAQAKSELMTLCGKVDNLDDMVLLDDMVQEILTK